MATNLWPNQMVFVVLDVGGLWRVRISIRRRLTWNHLHARIKQETALDKHHQHRVRVGDVTHTFEYVEIRVGYNEYDEEAVDVRGSEVLNLEDEQEVILENVHITINDVIEHDDVRVLRRWVTSGALYESGANDEFSHAQSGQMVRELVNLGFDPNQRDEFGASALYHMILRLHYLDGREAEPRMFDAVRAMVATGYDLDATFPSNEGVDVTPVEWARDDDVKEFLRNLGI